MAKFVIFGLEKASLATLQKLIIVFIEGEARLIKTDHAMSLGGLNSIKSTEHI